jgi:hypothetical protein
VSFIPFYEGKRIVFGKVVFFTGLTGSMGGLWGLTPPKSGKKYVLKINNFMN